MTLFDIQTITTELQNKNPRIILKSALEKFDNNEAVVRIKPMYLQLYERTGHLQKQISFEDYRQIFETIWHDRASKAGWNLKITYKDDECLFNFQQKK